MEPTAVSSVTATASQLRVRLMNVSQVCLSVGGTSVDMRPTVVELSRTDDLTVAVCMRLRDRDYELESPIQPTIVGRLLMRGPCTISDPLDTADHFGNCVDWVVSGPESRWIIRPYREEHIWIDEAFGAGAVSPDLASLYRQRRSCMLSVVAHTRLRNTTSPAQADVAEIHDAVLVGMRNQITKIERRIAALTKKETHGRRNAAD